MSFNIFFVLLLCLSYFSVFVSPENMWLMALLGLAYPYLLVVNILFTAFWIYRMRWYFLISFIAILAGYPHLKNSFRLPFKQKIDSTIYGQDSLKVFTYNAHSFFHDRNVRNEPYSHNFDKLINKQNPDILCIQEFYTEKNGYYSEKALCARLKRYKYKYIYYLTDQNPLYGFGMAIYSKYPIVNKGKLDFLKSDNGAIFVDIAYHNDTFRVYNVHLQSISFSKREYNVIDTLRMEYSGQIKEIKNISETMHSAACKRAEQVRIISRHIQQEKKPLIVCGDFNDPPVSYTYHVISQNLIDAFTRSGKGASKTFFGRVPSFRIDYILHSDDFESTQYQRIKTTYSDHYPVSCVLLTKVGNSQ